METKSWKDIKDDVYGKKGTDRRDELESNFAGFKIGLLLKKADCSDINKYDINDSADLQFVPTKERKQNKSKSYYF